MVPPVENNITLGRSPARAGRTRNGSAQSAIDNRLSFMRAFPYEFLSIPHHDGNFISILISHHPGPVSRITSASLECDTTPSHGFLNDAVCTNYSFLKASSIPNNIWENDSRHFEIRLRRCETRKRSLNQALGSSCPDVRVGGVQARSIRPWQEDSGPDPTNLLGLFLDQTTL